MSLTRTPLKRKRATARTTKTPPCVKQRCSRRVVASGLCRTHLIAELGSGGRRYLALMDAAYGPFDEHTGTRSGPPRFTDVDLLAWYERLGGGAS